MLLSNYILNGGVKPYLEYGWVCAPNTAGQSITANTITTLTIDTEVADTGNNGSISGNQITLSAGTYYYNGIIPFGYSGSSYLAGAIVSLYNITNSSYITRMSCGALYVTNNTIIGQFTILSTTVFEMRIISTNSGLIGQNYYGSGNFTNTTAGADQRTTIKLWKLA